MELQEGGCGVAGTSRDFTGVRSLGDAEQQTDHEIAPEQVAAQNGRFRKGAALNPCGSKTATACSIWHLTEG